MHGFAPRRGLHGLPRDAAATSLQFTYGDRTIDGVAPRNLTSSAMFLQIPRISESFSRCPLTISSHIAFRNLSRGHQAVVPFLGGSDESAFIELYRKGILQRDSSL